MLCSSRIPLILLGTIAAAAVAAPEHCPCGWRVDDTGDVYTHQIFQDFSTAPDVKNLLRDDEAKFLTEDWMIYDFWKNSDNPNIRLNTKFDAQNVQIKQGELVMEQKAYTDLDLKLFNPVSIAGMQTRATDILHGTFRTELKLEGYTGGSCASFFWYHNDVQELDIEVVTPGTSIVNDTINYTTQPSANADWSPIPNATLSVPLEHTLDAFRTHRFDCDPATGVKYYLDDRMVHQDNHNTPRDGGSLQLKLWADGNKWWSGLPSNTNVFMRVKSIIAYYNTTTTNEAWHQRCALERTQCRGPTSVVEKKPANVNCTQRPYLPLCAPGGSPATISSSRYPSFTGSAWSTSTVISGGNRLQVMGFGSYF